jgi:peptidoglycan/LPS O-acetylase OafA/YrhL
MALLWIFGDPNKNDLYTGHLCGVGFFFHIWICNLFITRKKITSFDWLTKYFKNRILRIYPIYILFSIIGFLFLILDKNPQTNYSLTKIISDFFF